MGAAVFFLEDTRTVLSRGMICSDLHFKDDSGNHETWLGLGRAEHSCLRAIAVISVRGDGAKSLWCWSLVSLNRSPASWEFVSSPVPEEQNLHLPLFTLYVVELTKYLLIRENQPVSELGI